MTSDDVDQRALSGSGWGPELVAQLPVGILIGAVVGLGILGRNAPLNPAQVTVEGRRLPVFDAFCAPEIIDGFQANVTVTAEPLEASLTLDGFMLRYEAVLASLTGILGKVQTYIAHQQAWWISGRLPKGAILFAPEYDVNSVIFVARDQPWHATLSTRPSVTATNVPILIQMIESFRFNDQ